jgi:hypothetical protein
MGYHPHPHPLAPELGEVATMYEQTAPIEELWVEVTGEPQLEPQDEELGQQDEEPERVVEKPLQGEELGQQDEKLEAVLRSHPQKMKTEESEFEDEHLTPQAF